MNGIDEIAVSMAHFGLTDTTDKAPAWNTELVRRSWHGM